MAEDEAVTQIFATQKDIQVLQRQNDQLETDMAAIAEGIKHNNQMIQSLLDAIEAEKPQIKLIGVG